MAENDLIEVRDSRLLKGSPPVHLLKRWIREGIKGLKLPALFDGYKWWVSKSLYEKWFLRVTLRYKGSRTEQNWARGAWGRLMNEEWIPVTQGAVRMSEKLGITLGNKQLDRWCSMGLKKGAKTLYLDHIYFGITRMTSSEAVLRLLGELREI